IHSSDKDATGYYPKAPRRKNVSVITRFEQPLEQEYDNDGITDEDLAQLDQDTKPSHDNDSLPDTASFSWRSAEEVTPETVRNPAQDTEVLTVQKILDQEAEPEEYWNRFENDCKQEELGLCEDLFCGRHALEKIDEWHLYITEYKCHQTEFEDCKNLKCVTHYAQHQTLRITIKNLRLEGWDFTTHSGGTRYNGKRGASNHLVKKYHTNTKTLSVEYKATWTN
ncbi:hypothetical protein TARUN_9427, partial [Trichoderma arundinaceum]